MRELNILLASKSKEAKRDLDKRVRRVAEPIRADAESLAVSSIPKVGLKWSRMRVGVSQRLVYVAPRERGVRGASSRRRPNFATLMEQRAMGPARQRNEANIQRDVEDEFAQFAARWNRI